MFESFGAIGQGIGRARPCSEGEVCLVFASSELFGVPSGGETCLEVQRVPLH